MDNLNYEHSHVCVSIKITCTKRKLHRWCLCYVGSMIYILNAINGRCCGWLFEMLMHHWWSQLVHRIFLQTLCSFSRVWFPDSLPSWRRWRRWEEGVAPHPNHIISDTGWLASNNFPKQTVAKEQPLPLALTPLNVTMISAFTPFKFGLSSMTTNILKCPFVLGCAITSQPLMSKR